MKKLLPLSVAALILMAVTTSADAQIFSVQFGGKTLNTTATGHTAVTTAGISAGELAASYWNPDTTATSYFSTETTGITGGLTDSNGNSSTITETKTDDGHYKAGAAVTGFASAGNNDLYNSGVYGPTLTLNLSGLNTADTYNLLVYIQDPNGSAGTVIHGVAGTLSYYMKTESNTTISSFDLATSTTSAGALPGTYFEFTGLTGSTIAASFTSGGGELAGFQLQQIVAAPEPSTWAMMLGGFGVLAFCVRRKGALQK